jgi:sulfotransferase famil protein
MRRDQLPPHKTACYVMPRWKAMYVSVNKAACTSLKWLVADIQEESRERFHRSLSREVSRTMTIHRRSLWQNTPMAKWMTDDELAAIGDDWFVFGVVRHPTARVFSAWQSKLLLREPWWWVDEFGEETWFPRVPVSGDDVVEDFVRFVRAIAQNPELRVFRNRHFAPQHYLLAADRMDYTRIYRTSEIPALLTDFERHLREQGWEGEPLQLARANETPLKPIPSLFTPEVLDAARELYRADFAAFGYDDPMPGGLDPSDTYSEASIAEVGRLIDRSERIHDLALRAQELNNELREAKRMRVAVPVPQNGVVQRVARRLRGRTSTAAG